MADRNVNILLNRDQRIGLWICKMARSDWGTGLMVGLLYTRESLKLTMRYTAEVLYHGVREINTETERQKENTTSA
jgi:hypothetical protein